jgi:MFS family permease
MLLALYLIQLRGVATGIAGLLIAPLAVTLALFSPLGGRTADRLGYQTTIIGGMAVVTLATTSMVLWSISTPAWIIVLTLIVIGLGMGFTQSPSATGVTLVVRDDERGVALGIFHMLRFISGTFSVTIFGIILEYARLNGINPLQAFHWSFYLLIAMAALAVVLAISMPRPPPVAVATPAN